jgi:hypothetical protein
MIEDTSVRRQWKGASLKVNQLLESALADGSASIYTTLRAADGRSAYIDLV